MRENPRKRLKPIRRCPALALLVSLFCLAGLGMFQHAARAQGVSCDPQVQGNRFFNTDRLLAEAGLKPHSAFSSQSVERSIERMLSLYEDNGFPYCRISPGNFRMSEGGQVSFSFMVEEGPQVKITQVQLEGLKSTRKEVILREMGTGVLGLFSQSRLDAGLDRVQRLSFIQGVEDVRLLASDDPGQGILKVRLTERRNNSIEGVLGYAPSAGERKGNIFGSLDLCFDNLFGTGRMMRWIWSRKDAYSSHLLFSYREPWVLGFPPSAQLTLEQVDYDSTYLKLSAAAGVTFDAAKRLAWGLELGWDRVVPGSAGKGQIPGSRKYMASAGLKLDLADRRDNPRAGVQYQGRVTLARKDNYPTEDFSPEQTQVSSAALHLDLNHFLPILEKQTLFAGIHLRELFTDERSVPVSDLFELGGAGSIRGYREGEFLGTSVAWTNLEYRFLLEGESRLYVFVDYGQFGRSVRDAGSQTLRQISGQKLGYGLGLRMDSKAGLLGLDYGLGQGDSITEGKIHLRLINRF
jgi:outer membrane protein insertion porin family